MPQSKLPLKIKYHAVTNKQKINKSEIHVNDMLMLNLLTLHRQLLMGCCREKKIPVKGFLFNAEQGKPQGIKAHQSRAARPFPPYTVIMIIVNKNIHYLHTFPTVPLGEADQCQHAAIQIQKKADKRRILHLNRKTAALHFKCVPMCAQFYQLNKVYGNKRTKAAN